MIFPDNSTNNLRYEGPSYPADLRIEAVLIRYAKRIARLNWVLHDRFGELARMELFSDILHNHPCLEVIILVAYFDRFDFGLVSRFSWGDGGKSAKSFFDAKPLLPKLEEIDLLGLVDSNQLGKLVIEPGMCASSLLHDDLTSSDSFFAALAGEEASLASLQIAGISHEFDEEHGHGDLARKLSVALDTNLSLQSLDSTISSHMMKKMNLL